jgi:hypothetical protein
MQQTMKWAYGITTIPKRKDTLFARTMSSLACAGFDQPRIFVDDCNNPHDYREYNLSVTTRYPKIRTVGNWMLGLLELYIREPWADRYAMFQDDIVTYPNLRGYLESCKFPESFAYWNLYTAVKNEHQIQDKPEGWHPSDQLGRGALALVFDRLGVQALLTAQTIIRKPMCPDRGWENLDGAIVTGLTHNGNSYKELVHNPSLVQHLGEGLSAMETPVRPTAQTFRGENFDALGLVKK